MRCHDSGTFTEANSGSLSDGVRVALNATLSPRIAGMPLGSEIRVLFENGVFAGTSDQLLNLLRTGDTPNSHPQGGSFGQAPEWIANIIASAHE